MKATATKLPEIPNKRYFTIGEVATLCAVKPHVLRYWEQEFSSLRPSKRKGSRRYYQKKDVLLVRRIRELLYDKGFTISGARQQLKALRDTSKPPAKPTPPVSMPDRPNKPTNSSANSEFIAKLRAQLETLLVELKD